MRHAPKRSKNENGFLACPTVVLSPCAVSNAKSRIVLLSGPYRFGDHTTSWKNRLSVTAKRLFKVSVGHHRGIGKPLPSNETDVHPRRFQRSIRRHIDGAEWLWQKPDRLGLGFYQEKRFFPSTDRGQPILERPDKIVFAAGGGQRAPVSILRVPHARCASVGPFGRGMF
jgi:hypothetical protein